MCRMELTTNTATADASTGIQRLPKGMGSSSWGSGGAHYCPIPFKAYVQARGRRVPPMSGEDICGALDRLRGQGASLENLLSSAVSLLPESHPKCHWTGIYELFPDEVLRLGPFVGAPTDHVFIAVGKGVCGTAVAERRNINVPDVSKVSNYLACSTSTKSELVVLIRRDDTIYAQIDIDSHESDAFDADAVGRVERVADWLADAYSSRAGA